MKPATLRTFAGIYLPKGGRAEVATAGLVIAVILAMILPMPTWLLDVLIALNISVAALMVVMVLQIRESTHLSAFPTLLLVTTLMRISVSIASTRLILLEGAAGHIIEAFGEVVVGGNMVVGLVVFLILTVVQFLVITKGSERVAEVGARFTLDAMPGKQLAIDMELKSGAATPEQTRLRRAALARESQFFGAMDGAMKFVKGDSIAGILVILINLIGGMAIGVAQRGLTASDAMKSYSILSIGDGLVAQIPALLMSVAAGVLITRVGDGGGENESRAVGKELAAQLLAYPRAWMTASVAIVLFGMLPGMPTMVFGGLAAGALAVGASRIVRQLQNDRLEEQKQAEAVADLKDFSPVRAFLVRSGRSAGDALPAGLFLNLVRRVRNQLAERYGMVLPTIQHEGDAVLADADVELCCDELRIFACKLQHDRWLVACDRTVLDETGVTPLAEQTGFTRSGKARFWVSQADANLLRDRGFPVQGFWQWAEAEILARLLAKGPRYFGIEQAAILMKWLASNYPESAKELERLVPPSRFGEVLQRLLGERVSIRNVYMIAQCLIEWGARERDPLVLSECVRSALGREICDPYAVDGELHAFVIDVELENTIRGAIRQTSFGDIIDLEQDQIDGVLDKFNVQLAGAALACTPVILCRADIRAQVRMMFRERFEEIPVLALSEVTPEYKVRLHGVVEP